MLQKDFASLFSPNYKVPEYFSPKYDRKKTRNSNIGSPITQTLNTCLKLKKELTIKSPQTRNLHYRKASFNPNAIEEVLLEAPVL